MGRTTEKGVVQVRVVADPDQTEGLAKAITKALEGSGLKVIQTSTDYPDRFDDGRRKFHITAMPERG